MDVHVALGFLFITRQWGVSSTACILFYLQCAPTVAERAGRSWVVALACLWTIKHGAENTVFPDENWLWMENLPVHWPWYLIYNICSCFCASLVEADLKKCVLAKIYEKMFVFCYAPAPLGISSLCSECMCICFWWLFLHGSTWVLHFLGLSGIPHHQKNILVKWFQMISSLKCASLKQLINVGAMKYCQEHWLWMSVECNESVAVSVTNGQYRIGVCFGVGCRVSDSKITYISPYPYQSSSSKSLGTSCLRHLQFGLESLRQWLLKNNLKVFLKWNICSWKYIYLVVSCVGGKVYINTFLEAA